MTTIVLPILRILCVGIHGTSELDVMLVYLIVWATMVLLGAYWLVIIIWPQEPGPKYAHGKNCVFHVLKSTMSKHQTLNLK